jgi:hypothetical protein
MGTKSQTEVKMVIRLNKEQGKDGLRVIKVEGRRGKEKEIFVRHEIVSSKWKRWDYDNLSRDWNKKYSVR